MTTLVVMTVGQSDVQVVVDGQRHRLDGNTCGALHDAINVREWAVTDAPSERSREGIKTLPEGELRLCTPKLDAVLAYFVGSELPSAALIFETTRSGQRDPRLSGTILEQRFRDRGVSTVTRVAFLTETEQLEDSSEKLDAVVRRSVIETLSTGVHDAVSSLTRNDRVFVAATGGLSAANELIDALVRLHSVGGPSVVALEVPDGDRAKQDDRAVEEKFHPAAGYDARWRALSLIEKGNFLGAWGAVSHLDKAPGQEWTTVIHWLALFAASLPLPTECDVGVLRHPRMAVRAALRVELALRLGDIPRAVHGTVAFFEAALWDKLLERFERSPDPKRRRYFRVKNGEAPNSEKLIKTGTNDKENRKRPFEKKDTLDGVDWYWIFDDYGGPAARIAKYFLQSEALEKFDHALGDSIRELRNDFAHNEPTPELMASARSRMQSAALWSPTATFLSQPLVRAVLKDLGEAQPEALLSSLFTDLRGRLTSRP